MGSYEAADLERQLERAEATLRTLRKALDSNAKAARNSHQLRITLNSIGDGVIATDTEGQVTRMNPAAEVMTGWREAEALGRSFNEVFRIFRDSGGQPQPDLAKDVLRKQRKVHLGPDTLLVARDGRRFRISDSATPIFEPSDGSLRGMVLVFSNVTEAYRLRREASRRERHLSELYDTAPVGIFTSHPDGRALSANQAMAEILDFKSSEEAVAYYDRLGMQLYDDPEDRNKMLSVILAEGVIRGFVFRARTRTGRLRWLQLDAVLTTYSGGEKVINGFVTDVTDRGLERERQLRREEGSRRLIGQIRHLLSSRAENLDHAITRLLSVLGKVCNADRAYLFRLDRTARTMTNTHEWCDDDIEAFRNQLQEQPLDIAPRWSKHLLRGETLKIRRVNDLPESWAKERKLFQSQQIQSIIGIPLVWGGEVCGFAGFEAVREPYVWQDEEIYLLATCAELAFSVLEQQRIEDERATLVKQLREARDHAEAAAQAKDDFLAIMSHEMRTPLNPIMGFVELLRETLEDSQDRQFLDIIEGAAKRQLGLIDSILNYSRLNRGKVTPRFTDFNLMELCEDALAAACPSAGHLDLEIVNGELEEAIPPDLTIRSEPNMLMQVLGNLLHNACKYTEKGSVKLHVGLRIEEDRDPVLCFCVEDSGPGIAREMIERLFEPFTQADTSMSRQFGGAGLGLAICFQITKALLGNIWVESRPGEGARFYVEVPVEYSEAPVASPTTEEGGLQLSRPLNVLVVEDEEDNARYATSVIERAGGKSERATDAGAALDKTREGTFDAILIDYSLPQVDGLELSRKIAGQAGGRNTGTPRILLTADCRDHLADRARLAGLAEVLHKPVSAHRLVEVLDAVSSANKS
ncbi:MAG: ATP-binding protein [Opitutales bacterium]